MDSKNIVSLVPNEPRGSEPCQAVIEWLESALDQARSGQLQAIAGACRFEHECTYHVMGLAGGFQMMGAMQMACYALAGVGEDE